MPFDIVCLSHLRWNFVFQRPQHLLVRAAKHHRVFYVEEPIHHDGGPRLDVKIERGVAVVVPHVPKDMPPDIVEQTLRGLLDQLMTAEDIEHYVLWYYTPMALGFSHHLNPLAVVFDCMDELSAFRGAPAGLLARESVLLHAADVVFTGGHSLFEAKKARHSNIHAFPSSVDVAHFAAARTVASDPADQRSIPRPRVGYFGVIDERIDLELLAGLADDRPDLQLVMVGPVVKIDPASLPQRSNLHWLGGKTYADLPAYIAGWDVAMMPFARNEATRYISPTKTPEYLAAGRPVVSTSIRDVVRPYEQLGLARIADTPTAFAAAIDDALREPAAARLAMADAYLADLSWDRTWSDMHALVEQAVLGRLRDRPRGRASATVMSVAAQGAE